MTAISARTRLGYVLFFLAITPISAIGETIFTVEKLTFNGGGNGAEITFDQATNLTVTEDVTNATLNLDLPVGVVRVKCDAQTDPSQCVLFFGGNQQTVDNDGDGVPDDVDQCLDTPAGATVDPNTGCEPQTVNTGEYCAGADPTVILCSANTNFDPFYNNVEAAARATITEPAGSRILSVPFTTQDSTTASGTINYITRVAQGGYAFKIWTSSTPGGTALSSACSYEGEPQVSLGWTQNPNGRGCKLGSTGRVLYVNFEAIDCRETTSGPVCDQPYPRDFVVEYTRELTTP